MPQFFELPVLRRHAFLALAYFVTGWLGLRLPSVGDHVTLVWLPTGIAVAALLRWGHALWPGVFLGAFLVNLAIGSSWPLALGIAVGNCLGPLLAATWLGHREFNFALDRKRDVGLLIAAAAAGMTLSATGGVACLWLAGLLPGEMAGSAWMIWWMGDSVGVLLAAPLILAVGNDGLAGLRTAFRELVPWLAISTGVAWLAFLTHIEYLGHALPLAFLTLPLLAWAALRFGIAVTTLASLGFSMAAAWGTATGCGTFALPDMHVSLALLWLYMTVIVLTGLLLSALHAERREVERTLRDSELRFRTLFDSSADAVLVHPLVGRDGGFGHFIEANEEAIRRMGYSRDELLNMTPLDLDESDTYPSREEIEAFQALCLQQRHLLFERVHVTRDGRRIPVEISSHVFELEGEYLMLSLVRDVSERQRAAEALRRAKEEAERANAAKSEFLANMSHEIRTPMNAVLGLVQLALKTPLSPQQQDYLTKIRRSSRLLLGILNDILDLSKIESGRMALDTHEFRLVELVDEVATLFAGKAESKGLELTVRVAPEVPALLIGDSLRLSQVLNNLVGNAVKFTEAGEINVRIEREREQAGEALLTFTIRDTGIGIEREQLDRLFQPFTQADGSITRRYGGTGLGLVISKRLVTLMGGTLRIESTPGRGSLFTFSCPFPLPPGEVARFQDKPEGGGERLRVLVVDDQANARAAVTEILRSWRFHSDEAEDGDAAIDRILRAKRLKRHYDLVLLDWKMPRMDGLETARRLRAMEHEGELSPLPTLIMVTAYSREQVLDRSDGHEFDAFLTKPVTPSTLFDALIGLEVGTGLRPSAEQMQGIHDQEHRLRGARILLVEDNEINRQVGQEMLGHLGVDCVLARDGREAVDRVARESFDAVLMDLQMPVMDGFQATREIRRTHPGLPIIAMTAAAMAQDRDRCLAAGMNDHLPKPVEADALTGILLRWIHPREGMGTLETPPSPSPTPSGDGLPERIPGIDLAAGLAGSGGNAGLFRELLALFLEQYRQTPAELAERLAVDPAAATHLLHKLKGTAATLGAERVKTAAARLETALDQGRTLPQGEVAALHDALEEVLDGLQRLHRRNQVVTAGVPVDAGRARELAAALRTILQRSELVPPGRLDALHQALGRPPGEGAWGRLHDAVERYDYDRALCALDELEQSL